MRINWIFGRRFREEGDEGGENRPTPAQINQEGNARRLSRIEEISRVADGRRAGDLEDVNGENATGRFAGGEFDESDEAKERRAEIEDQEAQAALDEQARAAAEAERLQSEGVSDEGGRESQAAEPGDEKLINGVKHYLTIVGGQERWLTLKQLRDHAATAGDAERALQQAQEALQRSTDASLRPNPGEEEADLDEADLENVVLSAVMGDGEAVKKLVQVLRKSKPGISQAEIGRQVSQRLATQRLVDEAEGAHQDVLSHKSLGPIFRQRLSEFARSSPQAKITDAYKSVADSMRMEFAPMLQAQRQSQGGKPPVSKADRKRTIVNPPGAASRAAPADPDDGQESVGSVIDQLAKGRGQERAIRQGRR